MQGDRQRSSPHCPWGDAHGTSVRHRGPQQFPGGRRGDCYTHAPRAAPCCYARNLAGAMLALVELVGAGASTRRASQQDCSARVWGALAGGSPALPGRRRAAKMSQCFLIWSFLGPVRPTLLLHCSHCSGFLTGIALEMSRYSASFCLSHAFSTGYR